MLCYKYYGICMYDFQNVDIAIKDSSLVYSCFLCVLLIVLFFTHGFYGKKDTRISLLLSTIIILIITFAIGPDKYPYFVMYKDIELNGLPVNWFEVSDPGWRLLVFVLSRFCLNEVGFFLCIAIFYVLVNRYFCLKQTRYSNCLFVAVIAFMVFLHMA